MDAPHPPGPPPVDVPGPSGPDGGATGWTAAELGSIHLAVELEIAARGPDGDPGRWTPIWVVCVDRGVYVRTWYRRGTGWFGAVSRSHRADVRVPGLAAAVTVEDVARETTLRAAVDAAYRAKYGLQGAGSMVTAAAAATTLRLVPARESPGSRRRGIRGAALCARSRPRRGSGCAGARRSPW